MESAMDRFCKLKKQIEFFKRVTFYITHDPKNLGLRVFEKDSTTTSELRLSDSDMTWVGEALEYKEYHGSEILHSSNSFIGECIKNEALRVMELRLKNLAKEAKAEAEAVLSTLHT